MIRKGARSSQTKKEIRGCIDLGSSFFRLLVIEGSFPAWGAFDPAGLEITGAHEDRRYVGWGEDLSVSGAISSKSVARAQRLLSELVSGARKLGCANPVIVGTNTLREARNALEVVRGLERLAGLPLAVLSQYEEARLAYIGSAVFADAREFLAILDIGGTSTEISWGHGIRMEGYMGFPLGTHQTRLLCGRRSYSAAGIRRAEAALAGEIRAAEAEQLASEGVSRLPLGDERPTILVTGGTAVSSVLCLRFMRALAPPFEEMYKITLDDVFLLKRRVAALAVAGRERIMPLDADRMRLLPAGLVLVEALLRHQGIRSFSVTARDLRWGVAITGGSLSGGGASIDGERERARRRAAARAGPGSPLEGASGR